MNVKIIIAIVFLMLFVGMIANMMYPGEEQIIPGTPGVPGTEAEGSDWTVWLPWDYLFHQIESVIPDPVTYMFSCIGTFLGLMTFQLAGVPTVVNTLLFVPFAFGILWLVAGMVRGSQGG